jgi:hypothetical protein
MTVRDLTKLIHNSLAKHYRAPYLDLTRGNLLLSVYFPKTQKYMNINNADRATLLTELGLYPGSVIHVQDLRSAKRQAGLRQVSKVKQDMEFVRQDFSSCKSARASFLQMSAEKDNEMVFDNGTKGQADNLYFNTKNLDCDVSRQNSGVSRTSSGPYKTFLAESVSKIDVILEKFIEHHQLFEFIELFRVQMKDEITSSMLLDEPEEIKLPMLSGSGKNFLHLAVEHNAFQILAYMLIELKVDANVLTAKKADVFNKDTENDTSEMSALHVAIQLGTKVMVDLVMAYGNGVDINLVSPAAGTPLHLACKTGNLKIVQKLVFAGADTMIRHPQTGLLARESTNNQRIIFLLEKYEKHQLVQAEKKKNRKGPVEFENSTNRSEQISDELQISQEQEEFWLDQSDAEAARVKGVSTQVHSTKGSFLISSIKLRSNVSNASLKPIIEERKLQKRISTSNVLAGSKLEMVGECSDEEDQEYYQELFMDELETGETGDVLDEATELHQ